MSDNSVKTTAETTENFEPKILVFACNWCTYAGADLAGTSRLQYPPNVRVLRVPCSCRVNPQFVIRAFQRGIDGVLVAGCHPGDCHYTTGNYYTRRRFLLINRMQDYLYNNFVRLVLLLQIQVLRQNAGNAQFHALLKNGSDHKPQGL